MSGKPGVPEYSTPLEKIKDYPNPSRLPRIFAGRSVVLSIGEPSFHQAPMPTTATTFMVYSTIRIDATPTIIALFNIAQEITSLPIFGEVDHQTRVGHGKEIPSTRPELSEIRLPEELARSKSISLKYIYHSFVIALFRLIISSLFILLASR